MSNYYMAVEHANGDTAYGTYGHDFRTFEEAEHYLAINGGGTIEIEATGEYILHQPTLVEKEPGLYIVDADHANMTTYPIDAETTGETPEVAERAVAILKAGGWNVEYRMVLPRDDGHPYDDTPAFTEAFWRAVQQASSELDGPLTVTECAALYGLSVAGVRLAAKEGRVQATKPGREYRIDRASAEARWGKRRNR